MNAAADQDVLSQLTALRQQLKNEEKRVQQQIDHTSAVVGLLVNYNAPRSCSKFCTSARTEKPSILRLYGGSVFLNEFY